MGFKEQQARVFLTSSPITAKILEVERFACAQDRFNITNQRSVSKVCVCVWIHVISPVCDVMHCALSFLLRPFFSSSSASFFFSPSSSTLYSSSTSSTSFYFSSSISSFSSFSFSLLLLHFLLILFFLFLLPLLLLYCTRYARESKRVKNSQL